MIKNSSHKILITGANGFIGKNLVNFLRKTSNVVFSPSSSEFDLRNSDKVNQLFQTYNPDIVVHLAADLGGIEKIRKNPASIMHNNLKIDSNIFDCSQKFRVKKLVCLNTVNIFPESSEKLDESEVWNGMPNPDIFSYAISKRFLLALSESYKTEFGLNTVNLIVDNTYGPHDNFDKKKSRVIPALIRRFSEAKVSKLDSVNIWGSGEALRQFLFVEDLVKVINYCINEDVNFSRINVSQGDLISIKNLAIIISEKVGFKGSLFFDTEKAEGSFVRKTSNERLKQIIEIDKFKKIDSGIAETVEWYSKNIN